MIPLALALSLLFGCDSPKQQCREGDPSQERHGTDCLCCHAVEFGVAGSVNLDGPLVTRVLVTDARGRSADMAPNAYGNFFRHDALEPPLKAVVFGPDGRASAMKQTVTEASCNRCHSAGGMVPPIHGPP
jgi:hypothetical protein